MAELKLNKNDFFGGIRFNDENATSNNSVCNTYNEPTSNTSEGTSCNNTSGTTCGTSEGTSCNNTSGTTWSTSEGTSCNNVSGTTWSTSEGTSCNNANETTWNTSDENICHTSKDTECNKSGHICGSFFETTDVDYNVKNTANVFTKHGPTTTYGTIEKNKAITKQGLWSKIKAFLFQEIDLTAQIKVELTPYQQKVEKEINDFLHQDVSFKAIAKLFK